MRTDRPRADAGTVLDAGTIVRGNVRGEEDLVLRGRLEGTVQLAGALHVEAGGVLKADAKVASARIAGSVVGNVVAAERIHLAPSARVLGNLRAPRIVVERGARISGEVQMDVEARAREEAPPPPVVEKKRRPSPEITQADIPRAKIAYETWEAEVPRMRPATDDYGKGDLTTLPRVTAREEAPAMTEVGPAPEAWEPPAVRPPPIGAPSGFGMSGPSTPVPGGVKKKLVVKRRKTE